MDSGVIAPAYMNKAIPKALTQHVLPFDWDVASVWALSAAIEHEPIASYTYLLHLPLWSSVPGHGMLFDTSPLQVLARPEQFTHQTQRINEADERYPIDTLVYDGQQWILDGVHRLAKLYRAGASEVAVRLHSEEVIATIRTNS